MKYVTVRVVGSGGNPQSNAKVSLYISQTFASGMKGPEYTNSDGEVDFDLDIDEGAQVSVYVNGQERVSLGSVKAEYRVIV